MRFSKYFLPTEKESPADAKIKSHKLMIRSGMIRKVAAGVYEYLPQGLKIMQKVEKIVREEMNRSGGQEIKLPIIQPDKLWKETGRWEDYGSEMFKLKDRKEQGFALGPTHEEVITDLARRELHSHKDLPLLLYQINDKFRDEIRPRYGLMRSREFVMKDGYSFHENQEGLEKTYREMYDCYGRIFDRCGLDWEAVEASSGLMGGSFSQEFIALSEEGGEEICICSECDYSANREFAEVAVSASERDGEKREMKKKETPGTKTVEEVADFLDVKPSKVVKTFVFKTDEGYIGVLIRGDHELAEQKLTAHLKDPNLEMVSSKEEIEEVTGADFGFIGPVDLDLELLADRELKNLENFVVGANEDGYHLVDVNWGKDLKEPEFADLREAQEGDRCLRCEGALKFKRGIEVGQIFQLGKKYSKSLDANYQNEDGELQPMTMGCYGIGLGRIMNAAIEQNYGENGVQWPSSIAPFQIEIISLSGKDDKPKEVASELYSALKKDGVETLLDDRNQSPGVKFNDAELIGAPLRIIVGSKGLNKGVVETEKSTGEKAEVKLEDEHQKTAKEIANQLEEVS